MIKLLQFANKGKKTQNEINLAWLSKKAITLITYKDSKKIIVIVLFISTKVAANSLTHDAKIIILHWFKQMKSKTSSAVSSQEIDRNVSINIKLGHNIDPPYGGIMFNALYAHVGLILVKKFIFIQKQRLKSFSLPLYCVQWANKLTTSHVCFQSAL